MNELEDRLARLMNDTVDVRTGPRREPPALRTSPARSVRPWFVPLVAAAAVAAVLLATFGITHAVTSHRQVQPAAPTTTVQLGAAKIALPVGWEVRAAPFSALNVEQWCEAPAHFTVTSDPGGCPVLFTILEDHAPVDVDLPGGGGLLAGGPPCLQGYAGTLDKAATLTFGGRSAEYRMWTINCSASHPDPTPMAQYVAPDYSGFILYSDRATAANLAALDFIAQHSTLPAQSGLRLQDRGIVRSVSQQADGVHVTIDRIVIGLGGTPTVINTDPTTYSYVLPEPRTAAMPTRLPKVGSQIDITTDGRSVTGYSIVP